MATYWIMGATLVNLALLVYLTAIARSLFREGYTAKAAIRSQTMVLPLKRELSGRIDALFRTGLFSDPKTVMEMAMEAGIEHIEFTVLEAQNGKLAPQDGPPIVVPSAPDRSKN